MIVFDHWPVVPSLVTPPASPGEAELGDGAKGTDAAGKALGQALGGAVGAAAPACEHPRRCRTSVRPVSMRRFMTPEDGIDEPGLRQLAEKDPCAWKRAPRNSDRSLLLERQVAEADIGPECGLGTIRVLVAVGKRQLVDDLVHVADLVEASRMAASSSAVSQRRATISRATRARGIRVAASWASSSACSVEGRR